MIKYDKNNNLQPDIKSFYIDFNGLIVFKPQVKTKWEYKKTCFSDIIENTKMFKNPVFCMII